MDGLEITVATRMRLLAEGLAALLRAAEEPSLRVTLVGEQDIPHPLQPRPDLLLCDAHLLAAALHESTQQQGLRVLLVSDTPHLGVPPQKLQEMVEMGLVGALSSRTGATLLLEAIKTVHGGGLWFDRQTIARSLRSGTAHGASESAVRLTRREAEVLQGICAGNTNKEIAQQLFMSEQTVKSHCNRLFKKFGVSNRVQLALQASAGPAALAG